MRVCITGASGFIGSALVSAFFRGNFEISGVYRSCSRAHNLELDCYEILDINAHTRWDSALNGVDCVVHCAAMLTSHRKPNAEQLKAIRSVNVDGTVNLASQAASAGVRRFVFLSSIKVHGEATKLNSNYNIDDTPCPSSIYGMSKLDAEEGLRRISDETGMEFVIIRLPLVYGLNARGNFAMLAKLVEYGIPLPFLSVKNRRSMISIDNLVDLVTICIRDPQATNQIFLASDDQDLSTPELVRLLGQVMGKPSRLFSLPPHFLSSAATIFGKKELADRLLGCLQVDISKTKAQLGWKPPLSVEEGLSRCFPKS